MKKEKLVDGLIANAKSPWKEEDKEALMKMSEEQLLAIVGNQDEGDDKGDDKGKGEDEGKTPEVPADAPKVETPADKDLTDNQDMTVNQYIDNAPKEMQGMLKSGIRSYEAEKKVLIEKIIANVRNTFTQEHLQAKEVSELTALAALAEEAPKDPIIPAHHFAGLGEIKVVGNQEGEEPLLAPTMNFESDK